MSAQHVLARTGVFAATVAVTGLLAAGTASAHVTAHVYGEDPEQEGYTAVTMRVPNEEADVGTTRLSVSVPEEYALGSASTKPVPGWSSEVVTTEPDEPVTDGNGTEVNEVVTEIVWEAEPGNEIAAGTAEYQEFSFSTGPLPSGVDELVLPAAQTYEDGEVVDWDAPPAADGEEEPSHPAPVVELAEPSQDGHSHGRDAEATSADAEEIGASDDTARWLAGAGLGLGALGLGVGIGATVSARRATSGTTTPDATNRMSEE